MTVDQLSERLEGLAAGEVEVLTRTAFETAFRALATLSDKKKAAITLGDWRRCGVIFIGTDKTYVSFTRRSPRPEPAASFRDAAPSP
jgi:hypothetical protein